MKKFISLLTIFLFLACNTNEKKALESSSESKLSTRDKKVSTSITSADYSSLLVDYQCIDPEEISQFLDNPNMTIEVQSKTNLETCLVQLSRNGDYESNLYWGILSGTKEGNAKAIAKALRDKERNTAVLGNDIVLAKTGDCYLEYIPIQGRINIRNANYDNFFQIFYGSKMRRTAEQQDEMKTKMTHFANYLLEKHRK